MKYILDTNICIYLINGNKSLMDNVENIGVYSLGITNASLAELYFGAYNSSHIQENLNNISGFKRNLTVYSDSRESSEIFGRIKAKLKSRGIIIEDFDILIGSIVIANECTLVTNNISHFNRIDDLKIENWLE